MTKSEIQHELSSAYPDELVSSLVSSYERAVAEYKKGHWQYCGNEVGQFIETARRMIEYQLDGKFTPLTEKMSIFSERVLSALESHPSTISEVYRVIIPRCLYSMYCLRNKRGMIHKSNIDPNKMDAMFLVGNMKWVFAEFFRLTSNLPFDETISCIESIMIRESSIVWDNGTTLRILDTGLKTKDKVLCLLYIRDNQTEEDLRKSIEYKNSSDFRKRLRELHAQRLIEYDEKKCMLSPLGAMIAEKLLSR